MNLNHMYYLVVKNLGVEKCIHLSREDLYTDGMSISCTTGLDFPGGEPVREVTILCTEAPDPPLTARVYRDRDPGENS
jgi:hypothetical protein